MIDWSTYEPGVHYHAVRCWPHAVDPLAAYVGLDEPGQYVGECGRAGSEWMARHGLCGHKVNAGSWWVMIGTGKQEPVEVPDREAAFAAILAAGATRMVLEGP